MSNKKADVISNTSNHTENYSDIEKHFLDKLVTQMEQSEERRKQRREEFDNEKRAGARATTHQFTL